MQSIIINTEDHYALHATVFEPQQSNHCLLLIGGATGVKQHVYFGFAQFMAEHGFTVLTYDYRGIGLSKPKKMKGFDASMRLWGSVDFKAVTTYVKNHFKGMHLYYLGHSLGALILGMNAHSRLFEEFIFVATQKAHVSNLTWKTRVEAYVGFGLLQPVSTHVFGYFPAHRFGLGESLPKGSAFDWRTLILNRKSTNRLLEQTLDISKELDQKVFVLSMEDDAWVTEKGVHALLEETYPNMKPTYRKVMVSESEVNTIGHVNFFRKYNKKLWNIILNEIEWKTS